MKTVDEQDHSISSAASRDRQFVRRLVRVLEEEPIEDGLSHPAETVLREELARDPNSRSTSIVRLFHQCYHSAPAVCAGLLRCIGRLDRELVGDWGWDLVGHGLAHEVPEVREAAIRTLEEWGGQAAVDILKTHEEPVSWLAEYCRQVILDLSH